MKIFALLFIIFFCQMISAETNELRWAADAEGNAPYIFHDPANPDSLIGFEVDIARALAGELNLDAVFVQNQWDGLIPGLNRMDYDIALNGIEITEERRSEVNFSIPYYITCEQLVVRSDEQNLQSLDNLEGKKAGALKSSLAERILNERGKIEVLTYEGEINAFEDLASGRLDAALVDAPIALYYASTNRELKLAGGEAGKVIYGIALRKNDTIMLNKINYALRNLIRNGKLRAILESWNLWNPLSAAEFDEYKESSVKPDNYNAFISYNKQESSFSDKISHYLSFMPNFGRAAVVTLEISLLSMLLAVITGLLVALVRVYAPMPLSKLAIFYIEIMRGTPLLIQLLFIYYGMPAIGIHFGPLTAAILGLGLNYAASEAENYRAGLISVPRGQVEAAVSLGMSRLQSLRHIVLPQAFRVVVPPMTNDFISLLKDSSLVSVITMTELTKVYNQVSATYFDYLGTGIIVAAIYMLLGMPFVKLSRMAERKLAFDRRKFSF